MNILYLEYLKEKRSYSLDVLILYKHQNIEFDKNNFVYLLIFKILYTI